MEYISNLAPSTIRDYSNIVNAVVASAVNENGEQLFPRTWSEVFIDASLVTQQKQPSTDKKGMESILKEARGRYRALYVLVRKNKKSARNCDVTTLHPPKILRCTDFCGPQWARAASTSLREFDG